MTAFHADLHCHTTFSDGTFTPDALLNLAKKENLSGLAITDHESIKAYDIALPLAKELGIEMISGAEFSALHNGTSIHVLGYAFYLKSPLIHEFCLRHRQRRTKRNQAILELLAKHNMLITEEEINLNASDELPRSIGRPHIALAMLKKGYVATIQEAFRNYLGEGKRCYAQGESFSVEETIDIIHQANGLAVIAHPHLISETSIMHQLLELKFDGIETYYANFPSDKNQRWMKIAKRKGWLMTGGSDFHGDVKPQIALGASWTPEETFRILQKHQESSSQEVE